MSKIDWALIGLILLGILLFLVGANLYNASVGWFGLFLFGGSILALIALYVYGVLARKAVQKP